MPKEFYLFKSCYLIVGISLTNEIFYSLIISLFLIVSFLKGLFGLSSFFYKSSPSSFFVNTTDLAVSKSLFISSLFISSLLTLLFTTKLIYAPSPSLAASLIILLMLLLNLYLDVLLFFFITGLILTTESSSSSIFSGLMFELPISTVSCTFLSILELDCGKDAGDWVSN